MSELQLQNSGEAIARLVEMSKLAQSEGMEADVVSLAFELKSLRAKLQEAEAQVAVCIRELKISNGLVKDCFPDLWSSDEANEFFTSLPDSAKKWAEVMRAAEYHMAIEWSGECACCVCNAVRAAKEKG